MKTLLTTLTALCLTAGSGDREEGLRLYREGRYAAAQAAFERALEGAPGSAELQWNLALAAWQAGDLVTAETAAEKFAAAAEASSEGRHRGMLGAIRYAEAEQLEGEADALLAAPPRPGAPRAEGPADPVSLLERAVEKAAQSKSHFVRAVRAGPTGELVRNTERAIRKLEELEQKLEDLKKQREQEPQQQSKSSEEGAEQDGEEGQQDPQQPDAPRPDEEQPGEQEGDPSPAAADERQQEPGGEQADPSQPPPETPEPQPEPPSEGKAGAEQEQQPPSAEGEERADPQLDDQGDRPEQQMDAPEPDDGKPRGDAPGEAVGGRALTPEQSKRLLDRLKEMEKQMRQARARARASRKPVERDW